MSRQNTHGPTPVRPLKKRTDGRVSSSLSQETGCCPVFLFGDWGSVASLGVGADVRTGVESPSFRAPGTTPVPTSVLGTGVGDVRCQHICTTGRLL